MDNSLNIIDRLVEFGMGMSLAQQMVNTMNQTMAGMTCAGANAPIQKASKQYYAVVDGAQVGPLVENEMVQLVQRGMLTADTLVWHQGAPAWAAAREMPEVMKIILLNAPAPSSK